jgi:hypothetical protein
MERQKSYHARLNQTYALNARRRVVEKWNICRQRRHKHDRIEDRHIEHQECFVPVCA